MICLHLAADRGLQDETRAELLYAGLLRDAGSTGLSPEAVGDIPAVASTRSNPLVRAVSRLSGDRAQSSPRLAHLSPPDRAAVVVRALGLPEGVAESVYLVDERWDGHGPGRMRGRDIPIGARVLAVASEAASAWERHSGEPGAGGSMDVRVDRPIDVAAIERDLRSQHLHHLDPTLVEAILLVGRASLWRLLCEPDLAAQLLDLEPARYLRYSDDAHIDQICTTFADLVDTRTPRMGPHGARVAALAVCVAERLGFDEIERSELRRAGLLHDLGKLIVPIAYLEKPSELTQHERKVVNEHARAGAAVLRRSRALAGLAPLMEAHHERLDGEGTFPAFRDERAALAARVIAVCDRYEAMTAERPYRGLLSPDQVWRLLEDAALEPPARKTLIALHDVVATGLPWS